MSVDIQLPSGYVLKNKTSRRFPKESFVSCELVKTNRAWWKFWLPSSLYSYTVIVSVGDETTKLESNNK